MVGNLTFSMIKPHAVKEKCVGEIIAMIERAGFHMKAMQLTQLSVQRAREFYKVHQGRPFYEQMCQDMADGPVVAIALEKDNAVTDFRQLLGATDPAKAAHNTIRQRFGKSIDANAVHGSDADETAAAEVAFFFGE